MKVLVPVDGSDCSLRALRFATEFVRNYESALHVVHINVDEGEATESILTEAEQVIEEEGVTDHPDVVIDMGLSPVRYADQIGKDILQLVDEEEYDHVVMGHHGTGRVTRAILGSAAETVVRGTEVSTTIIP